MAENLYDVLGVARDADEKTIKSAYKKLAKKYHPDISKEPDAATKMKEINRVYDILSDPKKRELYDEFGDKAIEADFNEEVLRSYQNSWGSRGQGSPFGPGNGWPFGFDDDMFSSMFGGGGSSFGGYGNFYDQYANRPERGQDYNADIDIDFRKAVDGGPETVSFLVSDANGQQKRVTYEINIPKGIREGQKIRLAGKGAAGYNGGADGDLILEVHIRPDSVFTRTGDDINVVVPISFIDAILGANIDVPTLNGTVSLKIPAGTQPGQKFRLKGKGVQSSRGTGDEYAEIKVTIPKSITDEQKDLLEKYRDLK